MIKEIHAKVLLSHVKQPDTWFGLKYCMNLYRGCQHRCIYCDSRSACYNIDRFDQDVLVKINAIDLLKQELARKRVKGTIGTGSMNDPYMPLERQLNLTGRALAVIAQHHFPVHIITKSNLVVRDIDTIAEINRVFAMVSFTITTTDDELAHKIEPGAPTPSARFKAMERLAASGIRTGVTMMPVLPFIEDTKENILDIVQNAYNCGATYILASFGVTLRDRQRDHYYRALDWHFPGVRRKYEKHFGRQYFAPVNQAFQLETWFNELCTDYGIATQIPIYSPEASSQLQLF